MIRLYGENLRYIAIYASEDASGREEWDGVDGVHSVDTFLSFGYAFVHFHIRPGYAFRTQIRSIQIYSPALFARGVRNLKYILLLGTLFVPLLIFPFKTPLLYFV